MDDRVKPDLSLEISNRQALFELLERLEAVERRKYHDAAITVMIKDLARRVEELEALVAQPHERLEALEKAVAELQVGKP